MRLVIGLTGGIGSGKSVVASLFARHGVTVVDTDAIAHELTAPGGAAIDAIRAAFGPEFIAADGRLDRARMRELVFRDGGSKRRLEAILHPLIRAESNARLAAAHSPYAILVIPLLVETGPDPTRYDRVLVVDCDPQAQLGRVRARDGLAEDQVRRILAAQVSRESRLAAADDVITNEGSPSDLGPQVERLHQEYLRLAAHDPAPGTSQSPPE